ncbi:unnamed protein product [marine sediment metagenome]|uniref:Uncharacterized protein n=1 Tax=marine sediment metagenome TaxID=412755 RepID=X0RJ03_9ZZZZ
MIVPIAPFSPKNAVGAKRQSIGEINKITSITKNAKSNPKSRGAITRPGLMLTPKVVIRLGNTKSIGTKAMANTARITRPTIRLTRKKVKNLGFVFWKDSPRLNFPVFRKSLKRLYLIPAKIASIKVTTIINTINKSPIAPIEPVMKDGFDKRVTMFSMPPAAVIGPRKARNPMKTKTMAISPVITPSIRRTIKKYSHMDQLSVCLKDSDIVSTKPGILNSS